MATKEIEKICKNCLIYDYTKKICKIVILHEGEKINLPMDPNDKCFFIEEIIIKDKDGKPIDRFLPEVEQIKIWVENENKKSTDGIVKIEYPKTLDVQT